MKIFFFMPMLLILLTNITFGQDKPECIIVTDKGAYIELKRNESYPRAIISGDIALDQAFTDGEYISYPVISIRKENILSITRGDYHPGLPGVTVRIYLNNFNRTFYYRVIEKHDGCAHNSYENIMEVLSEKN